MTQRGSQRDGVSQMIYKHLGVPTEVLEWVAGEREAWESPVRLWMDGWMSAFIVLNRFSIKSMFVIHLTVI